MVVGRMAEPDSMTEEQKAEIQERIARCREQRDHLLEMVKNIDRGEHHFRGPAGGPLEDVTEKHRKLYQGSIERVDHLIAAFEKFLNA
jgi:hypothetical protein